MLVGVAYQILLQVDSGQTLEFIQSAGTNAQFKRILQIRELPG